MKLMRSLNEYYDSLLECIHEKPRRVTISTFGIFAGITYDGKDSSSWSKPYGSETNRLFKELNNLDDVRVVVGVSDFISCNRNSRCEDCASKYISSLTRLLFHKEYFSNIKWKFRASLHFKCVVFEFRDYPVSFTGGRNMTNSSWDDISIKIDGTDALDILHVANDIYDDAVDLTDGNISSYIESIGLSDASFMADSDDDFLECSMVD